MSLYDTWLIFPALALALATTSWLMPRLGVPPVGGRNSTIDGLRGYLAFFVFLHHGVIWFEYRATGEWEAPKARLFEHFGSTSVQLFFMITAFLFMSKLIEARTRPMDWGRLLVGRVMRLAPLYLFVLAIVFIVVGQRSGWVVQVSDKRLFQDIVRWLTFTVYGDQNINDVHDTYVIVAGVTWSLAFEWFFYLMLPVMAVLAGAMPPKRYLLLGLVATVMFVRWCTDFWIAASFLGGIAAAFAVRVPAFSRFAPRRAASLLAVAALALTVAFLPALPRVGSIGLLSLAFALVAGGNSLFGLLSHPVSRTFGEMAYSLYLLHGMLLYFVFSHALGPALVLTPLQHWLVIYALAPVLVLCSAITYAFIERPGMAGTTNVLRLLEAVSLRKRLVQP